VSYSAPEDDRTIVEVKEYFNKTWNGQGYTADYSTYEDDSILKMFIAKFLETTGASTF